MASEAQRIANAHFRSFEALISLNQVDVEPELGDEVKNMRARMAMPNWQEYDPSHSVKSHVRRYFVPSHHLTTFNEVDMTVRAYISSITALFSSPEFIPHKIQEHSSTILKYEEHKVMFDLEAYPDTIFHAYEFSVKSAPTFKFFVIAVASTLATDPKRLCFQIIDHFFFNCLQ